MKVGDLVTTTVFPHEDRGEYIDLGIVIEKSGSQVWVRWVSDNLLQWTPKQYLEVVSEHR